MNWLWFFTSFCYVIFFLAIVTFFLSISFAFKFIKSSFCVFDVMLFYVSEYLLFVLIWYNLLSILVIMIIVSINVFDWLINIMTVYMFFYNFFRNLVINIFSFQFSLYVNVWNCDAYVITELNYFNLNNFLLVITFSSESSKIFFNFTTKFSKWWKICWISSSLFEWELIIESLSLDCIHSKTLSFKNEKIYNTFAVSFLYCDSFIMN